MDPYFAFSKLLKWRTRRMMLSFKQFLKRKQEPNLHDWIWTGTWNFGSKPLIITESFVHFVKCIEEDYFAWRLIPKLALQQTAMSSKSELRYRFSHSNYITLVTSLSSVTVCKIRQIGACCPRHCINIQPETVTCWKNIQSLGNEAGNNRRREPREYMYFTKCWSLFWEHGSLVTQPFGNQVMSHNYLLLRMPHLKHS